MRAKFYDSNNWKMHRLEIMNNALSDKLDALEKENSRLCRSIWEVNSLNFQLNEELERFKKMYQEAFEETIRLRHSEHKEKSMGEAIENELKRIIRQGYF